MKEINIYIFGPDYSFLDKNGLGILLNLNQNTLSLNLEPYWSRFTELFLISFFPLSKQKMLYKQ